MDSCPALIKLAYLIEVSIVLNLAYHELKSFKFFADISNKIKSIVPDYEGMQNTEVLGFVGDHGRLADSYRALMEFGSGKGNGWCADRRDDEADRRSDYVPTGSNRRLNNNRRMGGKVSLKYRLECFCLRKFYRHLLRKNRDRRITERLLAIDVIILTGITITPSDYCLTWPFGNLWNLLFLVILATTLIPVLFMILGRKCRRFILGWTEEDLSKGDINKLASRGRLTQLSNQFLDNFKKIAEGSLKNAYEKATKTPH